MTRLRIFYDFEAFTDQSRGGITRYVLELAERAAREADVLVFAGVHRSLTLREECIDSIRGFYLPPIKKSGELRRRLNSWLTRRAIARFRPDIVHRTYYRHAAPYRGDHLDVITLYDLTYFQFPHLIAGSKVVQSRMRLAAHRADHVICISQNTRADAAHLLSLSAKKTSVIPLGVDPPIVAVGPPPVAPPYLLFVGQRNGYKNFDFLVQALVGAVEMERYSLLAFGGGPFDRAERELLVRLGLSTRVRWMQGDDRSLAAAYTHAACLVYPSKYEGFGLPLLEAMGCGCPVACSNTSSLPEVGGDAAEYFDPCDPDSLTNALLAILTDPKRAGHLKQAGRSRAAAFTWDRCAEQTLALYHRLMAGSLDRV